MAAATPSEISLQPLPPVLHGLGDSPSSLDESTGGFTNGNSNQFLPQPSTTVTVAEKWNSSRRNTFRSLACFWAFIVMGANDAAYGALIPYLESYYKLTYVVVSMVFLSPLAGYAGAALLNNIIHMKFGQRGVALIGPICHLGAYVGIALHPPYPVLVVVFILAGFGNGLEDAGWNAWVGNMANSNEVLGFLHGFYGFGAVLSPLIATTLVTRVQWPWYSFYYIMIGAAAIELCTSLSAFWSATAASYRAANPRLNLGKQSRLAEALQSRVTWVVSFFLLGYVGVEVALGGWIVIFMIRERGGEAFASGMVGTGFWLGIAIGRVVLGFVTPRLGEKFAIMVYTLLAIVFQLLFWLAPSFHVSALAVSLQGFCLGPLFPAAVVAATRLLPTYMHVSAIGFAAAFGGGGAAVLPFAVGALAQAKGVAVLQPIILGILLMILGLWLCLPRIKDERREGADSSSNESRKNPKMWFNVDIDLVEVGQKVIKAASSSTSQHPYNVHPSSNIGQKVAKYREERAERRWKREQIWNIQRETPAFAVLNGVDPDNEEPPPYINVRVPPNSRTGDLI